MIQIHRVPKRVWATSGVVLALCGGVAAASAGSHATGRPSTADVSPTASDGRVLKLTYATPAPLVMPPPPSAADRLAVLAEPPATLGDLDPDLQQSRDYASLDASLKRYQQEAASAAAVYDARPLPTALSIDVPSRPEPIVLHHAPGEPAPTAHEDDIAASGDTGRSVAKTPVVDAAE